MSRKSPLAFAFLISATIPGILPGAAQAAPDTRAQVCAIGAAAVGQQGTLICKDVLTGETTQSLPLSATVSAAGGIGGNLSHHGDRVLVTNLVGGATLLREKHGWLHSPTALQTGGEGSLSGTLSDRGVYVLTGTRVLFFPNGQVVASSSQPLLQADGSAAQVTLAGGFAYVSEPPRRSRAFPPAPSSASPAPMIWSSRRSRTLPRTPTRRPSPSQMAASWCSWYRPRKWPRAGPRMTTAKCASTTQAA